MTSSSLFWKVLLVYAVLNAALVGLFLLIFSIRSRGDLETSTTERLRDSAHILRAAIEHDLKTGSIDSAAAIVRRVGRESHTRALLIGRRGPIADSFAEGETPGVESPDALFAELPIRGNTADPYRIRLELAEHVMEGVAMSARQSAVLWALGLGLLALVLTWSFARQMTLPLADLTAGAEAMLQGNFDHRVSVTSEDEIGTLANAFRKLQQELSQRFRQLQESNQRLTAVLSAMEEGVIAIDGEERILLANEAGRQMLEFVMPDVVGRPLLEATRWLSVHEAVNDVLHGAGSVQSEFEVPTSQRRVLQLSASHFGGATSPGIVIVLRDVTELRRLENLRREFVANVSHELKTPLSSIKAYAETLRLGALYDSDNNLKFVSRIEEQADRLQQLIVDLIHIARVETGRATFEIAEVPLAGVVERIRSSLADTAAARQIELRVTPPANPLHVKADEEGVYTILSNLVDNAIKYTPSGGSVEIRWQPDGKSVVVSVADTGIGIAPEHQARVFERFYRVDKARSRELGGTGLGLSIVKHLAQAFGGQVGLSSKVGVGSIFSIRLPQG